MIIKDIKKLKSGHIYISLSKKDVEKLKLKEEDYVKIEKIKENKI